MRQLRIAMDAREALNPRPTGKGVWARHALEELRKRTDVQVSVFQDPLTSNDKRATCNVLWHLSAAKNLRRNPPDVYLSPTSYIVPYLLRGKVPCIPIIHDLIAFDEEAHDRKAKFIERVTLPSVLKTAVHVCVVSESTKRELLQRFPFVPEEKISVVYGGSSLLPMNQSTSKRINESTYILCVATLCPRKNQLRLIEAYSRLPDSLRNRYKLLLVGGRGWQDDEIVKRAARTPNVEWRGYLPSDRIQELLRHSSVFAYPSLKEGFGIPVLDALSLGIPTLTSNRSSLQEVAGNAALLVDPESVEEIHNGLVQLLTDEVLCRKLRGLGPKQAARFSWKNTVDLVLEACERALPKPPPSPPPSPTGIPWDRGRIEVGVS